MKRDDTSFLDEKKLDAFRRKVEQMAKQELGTDSDGDPRLEVLLIDRSRFERMHFVPVPYHHKARSSAALENIRRLVALNLRLAFERWGI